MALWIQTLNLLPEWEQAKEGDISTCELARVVSERLSALVAYDDPYVEDERENLVDGFLALAEDDTVTEEDFDEVMVDLYDWADISVGGVFPKIRKVCWIKTF